MSALIDSARRNLHTAQEWCDVAAHLAHDNRPVFTEAHNSAISSADHFVGWANKWLTEAETQTYADPADLIELRTGVDAVRDAVFHAKAKQ